jgi:hypothetical protein
MGRLGSGRSLHQTRSVVCAVLLIEFAGRIIGGMSHVRDLFQGASALNYLSFTYCASSRNSWTCL